MKLALVSQVLLNGIISKVDYTVLGNLKDLATISTTVDGDHQSETCHP
jgi:hypothetical protein